MEKMTDILNGILRAAFEKTGHDTAYAKASLSSRPDLCEYQCNGALPLAKTERRKPIDIAEEICAELKSSPAFSKAETCMPGFINLDLSPQFVSGVLADMAADSRLGVPEPEKKQKILVDYGGANVAKPLHVGHLRSAVIGEALKRMGAAIGHEMTGDVHLGDWGLQMGLIIAELEDRGQTEFDIRDLEEIYPAASAKSKDKGEDGKLTEAAAAFRERALRYTGMLQSGDPRCRAIWERIMELSLADLRKNYDALDVHFELWKGESDVQKYIPDMLKDFEDRGIAYESEGALVVDVSEPGDRTELPPCIVRKSDGASLYATTDLATLVERELLYRPDSYVYVADKRQDLHYTSFFRVARKAGIVKPEQGLTFLGFGTMNGRDGKPFKTREGGVMRLSVLIGDIEEKVLERIRETRPEEEIPEAEARAIAKTVGLAALKYGDLSNQASKDYIFDIDRFTSFEGNTGPYILYTIVRINSILAKSGEERAALLNDFVPAELEHPSGKALALSLARFGEVLEQSWDELAPHKLCQYIYELSNEFNSFYHEVKVLGEPDGAKRASYLALLSLTVRVLTKCIGILGFSAPERM